MAVAVPALQLPVANRCCSRVACQAARGGALHARIWGLRTAVCSLVHRVGMVEERSILQILLLVLLPAVLPHIEVPRVVPCTQECIPSGRHVSCAAWYNDSLLSLRRQDDAIEPPHRDRGVAAATKTSGPQHHNFISSRSYSAWTLVALRWSMWPCAIRTCVQQRVWRLQPTRHVKDVVSAVCRRQPEVIVRACACDSMREPHPAS